MPHTFRNLSRYLPHLMLPLAASFGCSNVVGVRSADSRKIQTFASIGDKPLPTLTGTPGQTVVAGINEPERTPNPRGQISGRVVDSNGEPVPNADVRVAIGGASAGRTAKVTTDDAGRFALSGLRSGGEYTVIAETEDDDGSYLEGRIDAEAPQKQLKITLRPLEDEIPKGHRVGRVSEKLVPANDEDEADQVEADPNDNAPRINFEDLPPAAEAESIDDVEAEPSEDLSVTSSRPIRRAGGWRGYATAGTEGKVANAEPRLRSEPVDHSHLNAEREPDPIQPAAVPDGPNPLPPALEPPQATTSEEPFTALPDRGPGRPTDGFAPAPTASATPVVPAPAPEPAQQPTVTEPAPAPNPPAELPFESAPIEPAAAVPPSEPSAAPSPAEVPATATAPVSEPSPEPVATAEAPSEKAEAAPASTEPTPEPASPAPAEPAATEPAVPDLLPEEAPAPEAALARPKWGDLAQVSFTPEAAPNAQVAPVAAVEEGLKTAKRKRWFFQTKAAEPVPAPGPTTNSFRASCEYVPKDRRLVDFRLADLDGRPVSFHELGADLVLLDFWGTWCGPCLNSIPRLVELQNLYPESKLKVVGIAYEQDDLLSDRVRNVRKTAAELGIPYTVLLGEADDKPCPLKEALHVQVYPTMILVDRQGNLVWRDQGVGPNTFARLERILATRAGQEIARR